MKLKSNLTQALLFLMIIFIIPFISINSVHKTASIATKLIDICGSTSTFTQALPERCGSADFAVEFNDQCVGTLPITIFLSNISSNTDPSIIHSLPPGTAPMHIRYEYAPGIWKVTQQLTAVKYKVSYPVNGSIAAIFGIDVHLETLESSEIGCQPNESGVRTFTVNMEVVTPSPDAPDGFDLYPIHNYAHPMTGIFSCEIFMETHLSCEGIPNNPPPPVYAPEYCLLCGCSSAGGRSNEGVLETTMDDSSLSTVTMSPNPFNDFVDIQFDLSSDASIGINIYDALGERVYTETDQFLNGQNNLRVNTKNLSAGIYYIRIDNGSVQKTKKLILLDH